MFQLSAIHILSKFCPKIFGPISFFVENTLLKTLAKVRRLKVSCCDTQLPYTDGSFVTSFGQMYKPQAATNDQEYYKKWDKKQFKFLNKFVPSKTTISFQSFDC